MPAEHERLARYWDAVTRDQDPDPTVLDPDLAATVLRFHGVATHEPGRGPDPRFVDRLMEELMTPASPILHAPFAPTMKHVAAPNGKARWPLAPPTPKFPAARGRWALSQLATAALVLLTLAASLFAFAPGRIGRRFDQPVFIPAVNGTPATPDAVEMPVAELVWSLDGGPRLPFNDPTALALDPAGNLWVPDGGNDRFQIFTPDGGFLEVWGEGGDGDGQFNLSLGAYGYGAVDWDADGNIYVADSGNHRIQKFAPDRTFLAAWGSWGEGDGQFLGLNNIAIDRDGRLYASDHERDDIQVFDTEGGLLGVWGEPGFQQGQLQNPGSVTQDASGNFYVNEYLNHRIQVFSRDGVSLSIIGEMGEEDSQVTNPTDVAIDADGYIFVADYGNHRIQILDAAGRYLGSFGEMGFEEGQFVNPIYIVLDGEGNIYVSDEGSDRVQKFRLLPPFDG